MDWKDYDQACDTQREIVYKEMQHQIATLTRERDELRELVVWLARERIRAEYLPNCGVVAVLTDREWAEYPCDGTPTSIIEALRRAKEGRGDGR